MGSLSKSLTSSPSSHFMKKNMEQEVVTEKRGIVTILGPSDSERTKAASLRRTLSADMSSKRWLSQHGFSPMKKIASSEELCVSVNIRDDSSSSSEDVDHYQDQGKAKFHIWSSIDEQAQKQKNKAEAAKQQPGQADLWSSIVCQKANEEEASKAAPYVHPLVKKQSSSLTKKSLEVCTESLGSETGSEGFASYPTSETGDVEIVEKDPEEEQAAVQQQEEEKEKPQLSQAFDGNEFRFVKYNSAASKKLPSVRSFPPPLPSLSGYDGESVCMRTRRDNGRLVLEAVSMPSLNNFRAQRQDGRLVLTFLNATSSSCEVPKCEEVANEEEKTREQEFDENVNFEEGEKEKESEKSDGDDVDEDEEEESDEVEKARKENGIRRIEIVMEEAPRILTSRVTNVHRLALMMNKPIGLDNKAHGWTNKFNEVVKYGGVEEEVEAVEPPPISRSLPPLPGRVARMIPKPPATTKTAAAATSFNAYEYHWRTNRTTTAALKPLPPPMSQSLKSNGFMSQNQLANEQQQLLVLRGNKGDQLVPFSKGCKEPRIRSLLFREPYCIATS
ncbi:protein FAF-like, chloroplastic [Pyrus x bretschneideri]|uniref:protein FAF-like, chloroplastic n=1 Tax=Pyrus x bretschneideri TaxID=225117 RepID=UPI00202EDF04|nr:protein FAF-like, chloroplastic [Pyrus x bretschneideri]